VNDGKTADFVRELDSIDAGDPERAHGDADEVLLRACPADVRAAYQRLTERANWWASA